MRKFVLFWNHYEIPNHHNFYFIGINYAPLLRYLVVGFWLVAPLSMIGMLLLARFRESRRVHRLYLAFVLVYMASLIPFFVTARYRLPVVPFLIVFAAIGVFELTDCVLRRRFKRAAFAVLAAVVAAVVVWWPMVDYDFGFSHTVMGTAYSDLATREPDRGTEHIANAILHFKKAIELRPLFVDAHYNLGISYQRIGYFSGAVNELEMTLALKPNHRYAAKALSECRSSLLETGDKIGSRAIPLTPFEKGLEYTSSGKSAAALDRYRQVLREDPHHPGAYSQLGAIAFDQGDYSAAISYFRKGLNYQPDHFVLNNNIAGAYYRKGEWKKARHHWQRCLEIQPGNENVERQLRLLNDRSN
jgi:Flp pilus assembly protein TadD